MDRAPLYSILCPTRGRPERAIAMAASAAETAAEPADVEVLFYADRDDPSRPALAAAHERALAETPRLRDLGRLEVLVGDPISISVSWNALAARAQGEVLIIGNDDAVYRTPGWDRLLGEAVAQYPDGIYCAWFNDLLVSHQQCAFPMVSRRWYEILGYLTPGVFLFGYNDTWIEDIGKRLGRLHYIKDVVVEHYHAGIHEDARDATHERNAWRFAYDRLMHERTARYRALDAELLRRYMTA